MARIRRLVLDVLKPHEPSTIDLAAGIADLDGIDGVNAVVVEIDRDVQNVKLTVEGESIDIAGIEDVVDELGASMHSVDQVACGDRLVEESDTPQD